MTKEEKITHLKSELEFVKGKKAEAINGLFFEIAAFFRDRLKYILEELSELEK